MRRYAAEGALVLAALCFGATFPLVHAALADIEPFAYLVLRFSIAVLALGPFALAIVREHDDDRRLLVRVGLFAGVLLAGGYAAQTAGLQLVSPSTSAFITGLYVVLTPIIESIVRRRLPDRAVLGGVVVAAAGLYLLSGAEPNLGAGELLTLLAAVLFAIWIVYQGEYAHRLHPIPFATVQLLAVALVCVPPIGVEGVGTVSGIALIAAVVTGVACSAFALSLQVWGQRRLPPSRTALILMLEPVFAGVAGYVSGERLGAVELLGAGVILAGIALAELGSHRPAPARPELEPHPF